MPVASVSSLLTQRRNYVAASQADARCERVGHDAVSRRQS